MVDEVRHRDQTQQAQAHIGHECDTQELIMKQGNSLGVRLQERDGDPTRYLVGKSPKNVGRKRPRNFNIQSSCNVRAVWQMI